MASSSSLTKFDQRHQKFYICRKCNTQIALDTDLIINDHVSGVGIFFENQVVNVQLRYEGIAITKILAGETYRKEKEIVKPSRTYAEVHCVGCNTLLGERLVAFDKEDSIVKIGRNYLTMTCLIFWDGKKMMYAHNMEPVDD